MSIILTDVRLSKNPAYEVIECNDGVSGFANRTLKNKKVFVTVEFEETQTKQKVIRRYFQNSTNKKWEGSTPKQLMSHIKKEMKREIISRQGFSTFIFEHELNKQEKIDKVFETQAYLGLDNPEELT